MTRGCQQKPCVPQLPHRPRPKLLPGAWALAWLCGKFGARSPVGLKPPTLHGHVWRDTRKVASPVAPVLLSAWYGRRCCQKVSRCQPQGEATLTRALWRLFHLGFDGRAERRRGRNTTDSGNQGKELRLKPPKPLVRRGGTCHTEETLGCEPRTMSKCCRKQAWVNVLRNPHLHVMFLYPKQSVGN